MMTSLYGLFGWHVHLLFGIVLVLGAVFFVVWALRSLDKKELCQWALWLLVIGVLGVLLTVQFGLGGLRFWGSGGGMMGGGMMGSGMMGGVNGFQQVNWQEMAEDMMTEDHSKFTTPEQWRDHMFEEMREHMGR